VFLNRIGANAKLELTGNRLGAIHGVGVRNDIAKLVPGSIYRQLHRWRLIWSSNAAVGDKEGRGCGEFVSTVVASSPATIGQS
jgi:hypothetical protein